MKPEMQIRKTSNGDLTIYHIIDRFGETVTLNPEEALLVLQFLYEDLDEITRLVNSLPHIEQEPQTFPIIEAQDRTAMEADRAEQSRNRREWWEAHGE